MAEEGKACQTIGSNGVNFMGKKASFVKVKCGDCGNEQIAFKKSSTRVSCHVCGSLLVEPKGGCASFKGEITEEVA